MGLFGDAMRAANGDERETGKSAARNAASVIDMDGIEHEGVMVEFISKEDWDEYVGNGMPEMIGTIYGKDIFGPGFYYLSGSYSLDGLDAWRPVAKLCSVHGERVMTHEELPAIDALEDVKLITYVRGNVESDILMLKYSTRGELVMRLLSGIFGTSIGNPVADSEVVLSYVHRGEAHTISLVNCTSDKEEEWYSYKCNHPTVAAAVMNSIDDLPMKFHDEHLRRMAQDGTDLNALDYIDSVIGKK